MKLQMPRIRLSGSRLEILSVFFLTLFLPLAARAQEDSLADVFPLKLGNRWVYDMNSYDQAGRHVTSFVGTATSQIVNVVTFPDSALWTFRIVKDYNVTTRTDLGSTPGGHFTETLDQTLTERFAGTHEILGYTRYGGTGTMYSPALTYPVRLSRYSRTGSAGVFNFGAVVDKYYAVAGLVSMTLKKDVGITISGYPPTWMDWRGFTLVRFEPGREVPGLVHPAEVRLQLFVGTTADTTISVSNDGTDTLRFQAVTTSDPELSATLSSGSIPFTGQVPLRLRFTSPTAGSRRVEVYIRSNASTSPDTLVVTILNLHTGVAVLNTKQVDLPQFDILWHRKDTTLTITNTGNAPLRFDSVSTTNSEFSVVLDMSNLAPGSQRNFRVQYVPMEKPWDRIYDTLCLYTNSPYSPDAIRVSAWAYGATFVPDHRHLDFGKVPLGSIVERKVPMRRLGWATIGVRRAAIIGQEFTAPMGLDIVCDNCDSVYDVMRFRPTRLEQVSGFAVYTTRSGGFESPDTLWMYGSGLVGVVAPDEFRLNQNYPNPFNGSTTVQIDIPEACELTFTVTDMLGRTVMASTGFVPAGVHMKTVDAQGLATGVYLYSVRAGRYAAAKKMLLVR